MFSSVKYKNRHFCKIQKFFNGIHLSQSGLKPIVKSGNENRFSKLNSPCFVVYLITRVKCLRTGKFIVGLLCPI